MASTSSPALHSAEDLKELARVPVSLPNVSHASRFNPDLESMVATSCDATQQQRNLAARNVLQPMRERFHTSWPPPFLTKTYDMIDDAATDAVVSWSAAQDSFIIWNLSEFCQCLLPRYFKHNNVSSFVRQLNTYGFRKMQSDYLEFAHDAFWRGGRHLLRNIHRRKPAATSTEQQNQLLAQSNPCSTPKSTESHVYGGKHGLEGNIEQLKCEKETITLEIQRLRQQQLHSVQEAQAIARRVEAAENRQEQMMNFVAKAFQNRAFVTHLMQQSEVLQIDDESRKRRQLPSATEEINAHMEMNTCQEIETIRKEVSDNDIGTQEFICVTEDHMQAVSFETSVTDITHLTQNDTEEVHVAPLLQQQTCVPYLGSSGSIEQPSMVTENLDILSSYIEQSSDSSAGLSGPQLVDGFSELELVIDLQEFMGDLVLVAVKAASMPGLGAARERTITG